MCWGTSTVSFVLLVTVSASVAAPQDPLAYVGFLHRHGDRAPTLAVPAVADTFAEDWPLGPGQLTGHGMTQLLEVGQKFHQKYVVNEKFLPPSFRYTNFQARSSDIPRTLQSAASLQMGLFPIGTGPNDTINIANGVQPISLPSGYQPVPISTVEVAQDRLIVGYDYTIGHCPKVYQPWNQSVYDSHPIRQALANRNPVFARVSPQVGFPLDGFNFMYAVDTFICYQAHGLLAKRFPQLSSNDFNSLLSLRTQIIRALTSDHTLNCLMVGLLMKRFIDHMDSCVVANTSACLKVAEFSGHDTTVLPLMAALKGSADLPPYATHVVFELRRPANGEMYVNSYYNDQPLVFDWCGGTTDCPYSTFRQFFTTCGEIALDFNAKCGIDTSSAQCEKESEVQRLKVAVTILAVAVVVAFIAIVVLIVRQKVNQRPSEYAEMLQ